MQEQTGIQKTNNLILESIGKIASGTPVASYKNYCGEYGTASAFALWLACEIIEKGITPPGLKTESEYPIKSIIIFDQKGNSHHSMIMVSSC